MQPLWLTPNALGQSQARIAFNPRKTLRLASLGVLLYSSLRLARKKMTGFVIFLILMGIVCNTLDRVSHIAVVCRSVVMSEDSAGIVDIEKLQHV